MSNPTPNYTPAPHLVESSPLTAEDLTHYYEDFYNSLEYISCAPSLVFERTVANIFGSKATILPRQPREETPHHDTTALEECRNENKRLQLEINRLNAKLSETRVEPRVEPRSVEKVLPNTGTFFTCEVLPSGDPGSAASKEIFFSRPYSEPPGISLGLRWISVKKGGLIRVDSYATNIQNNSFRIHSTNWCNKSHFQTCTSWLEISRTDPDIQFGTFSTQEDHPWVEARKETTRQITFPRAYDKPPQVVVWLTAFQMFSNTYWRIKTTASDITSTGFTLHLDTWADTVLVTATASWLACTANKPNICTGTFKTSQYPLASENGYKKFESGNFTSPPRVMLAINSFDMRNTSDMRIKIASAKTDINGVSWCICTWDDTYLYSAGASFIALG